MKLLTPLLCLICCLASTSCEKQAELRREISALETATKQDTDAISQYERDIATLGGTAAITQINEETKVHQQKIQMLEFETSAKENRWAPIESEFSKLKPAAEAYKAAQPK